MFGIGAFLYKKDCPWLLKERLSLEAWCWVMFMIPSHLNDSPGVKL